MARSLEQPRRRDFRLSPCPAPPFGPAESVGQHARKPRSAPNFAQKNAFERTLRTYFYEKGHKNTPFPPRSPFPDAPPAKYGQSHPARHESRENIRGKASAACRCPGSQMPSRPVFPADPAYSLHCVCPAPSLYPPLTFPRLPAPTPQTSAHLPPIGILGKSSRNQTVQLGCSSR